MLKKITLLAVVVLFSFQAFGQSHLMPKLKYKIKNIDGTEMGITNNTVVVAPKTTSDHYFPVTSPKGDLTFEFHPTGVFTGYDLESNGSTQQIWQDPNRPDTVHLVYMWSSVADGTWGDRASAYIVSTDAGLTWLNYGNVGAGRTGYPSISGLPSGKAVVGNHSAHGLIYVDEAPAAGNFTTYDPGTDSGAVIWPQVCGVNENKVAFAGSQNPGISWTNTLNLPAGTFTGFHSLPNSASAETYHVARNTDGSVVGVAYLGEGADAGDVFYRESNDGGETWTDPLKIWNLDTNATGGTLGMVSYGPIRGVELTYLDNTPNVVFEIGKQDIAAQSFYPGVASFIGYWNPELPKVEILADTNNIEEWPSTGTNDVFFPVCRPVIGRSFDNKALFVSFNAANSHYMMNTPGTDSTAFYDVYFMSSIDSGKTWTGPVKMNPATPLRDWRFPSMTAEARRVGDNYIVQMTAQSDSIPGSTVNAITGTTPSNMPVGVTAELVGITTSVPAPPTVGVNDPKYSPFTFSLSQNYPNPFNPSTKIKYSVAERSNVTLKVFDVLGREVATLVNQTMGAGSYTANFDASKLSSGLYIYKLTAGSNTLSKKMMLVK